MKKKKFNFIKKLFYTLIFGFSSICLLGGWTTDNQQNINNYNSLFGYLYNIADIRIDLSFTDGYTSYTNWFETDVESTFGEIPYIDISYDSVNDSILDVLDSRMDINDVQNLKIKISMYSFRPENIFSSENYWNNYATIILSGGDYESYTNGVYFGIKRGNTINPYNILNFNWNTSSFINYNGYSYEIYPYNELDFAIDDTLEYVEVIFNDWNSFTNFDETGSDIFQFYINTSPIDYYLIDNMELTLLSKYNTLFRNYNTLQTNYNTLQTNYNTLQTNYNTLQTNYTNLENEYSLLNTQYETLDNQLDELRTEYNDLQSAYEQLQQEYEDYQDLINNTIGNTSFDISQYSVSVGSVPNQISFNYTKSQDISNNFSNIGYLNIRDIYTNYIQTTNNNTIYITTPQNNLLTFDMTFNYESQPNTVIKTNLYLPNGDLQQFSYSVSDFKYTDEWTLANLVATSVIGSNYNLNEISYKDILITYESPGSILNEIKIGSNNGYNSGFNSGYNSALNKINEIQQELNTKTSLLEKTAVDLQNKTNEYNMLLARYQQVTETPLQLNFQNLIWTIASSPFESFKQIWNVDILGFNIANFVIGVMSVFVVMYIIKKIF